MPGEITIFLQTWGAQPPAGRCMYNFNVRPSWTNKGESAGRHSTREKMRACSPENLSSGVIKHGWEIPWEWLERHGKLLSILLGMI